MVNGKYCTVTLLGRQSIDGGVHPCLLDGVKLRYSGIFQLMRRQGLIALDILATTDDGISSEGFKSIPTLASLVIFK